MCGRCAVCVFVAVAGPARPHSLASTPGTGMGMHVPCICSLHSPTPCSYTTPMLLIHTFYARPAQCCIMLTAWLLHMEQVWVYTFAYESTYACGRGTMPLGHTVVYACSQLLRIWAGTAAWTCLVPLSQCGVPCALLHMYV